VNKTPNTNEDPGGSGKSESSVQLSRHGTSDNPEDARLRAERYRYLTSVCAVLRRNPYLTTPLQRALIPYTVDVDDSIPPFDPYLYQGTLDRWDDLETWKAFVEAPYIEVQERSPLPDFPVPMHGLTVGGVGGVYLRAQLGSDCPPIENRRPLTEIWTLKVTKAGLLFRKGESS
jgi:hypothetical protein